MGSPEFGDVLLVEGQRLLLIHASVLAINARVRRLPRVASRTRALLSGRNRPLASYCRAVSGSRAADTLGRVLQRGREDGTIRSDVTAFDLIVFGALLAQPLPHVPDWKHTARRQAAIYLDGLGRAAKV
jgi:hypothetical protein